MMKLSKRQLIYLVIILFFVGSIYFIFFSKQKSIESLAVAVTTGHVFQKGATTITTHAIGRVQPYNSVSVKSRVDGQLMAVKFKEGDFVKKDQILFEIDPRPFQVALEQAQANLARDQAQLENAQKLLGRYSELQKSGYISKRDYDDAASQAKSLNGSILADKAAIANAELLLAYCTIRSPIDGRTGNYLVNEGNLIKANDVNSLVTINQIDPIYIEFSLPEHQLSYIQEELQQNNEVAVTANINQVTMRGKLIFIDNNIDSSTSMFKLKALFDNPNHILWPGQYATVSLPLYQLNNGLFIPTRAIQSGTQGSYVFVVQPDQRVKVNAVQVLAVVGDNTAVKGLDANAEVVLTGQSQLVDNSVVRVIK